MKKRPPKGFNRPKRPPLKAQSRPPAPLGLMRFYWEPLYDTDILGLISEGAKQPLGFRIERTGKRKPKTISPATAFFDTILSGKPFMVNGIDYRPARARRAKKS